MLIFDPPQELVQDVLIYLQEESYEGLLHCENEEVYVSSTFISL